MQYSILCYHVILEYLGIVNIELVQPILQKCVSSCPQLVSLIGFELVSIRHVDGVLNFTRAAELVLPDS